VSLLHAVNRQDEMATASRLLCVMKIPLVLMSRPLSVWQGRYLNG
jgi:hypothetical protein